MKSFQHFCEAFVAPDSNVPSESGYLYHATNEENAADIADSALKCFPPHHGTDQRCWPDGKCDKRAYFTEAANKTWMFAPEHGKPVLLRTPHTTQFKKEIGTGDVYTTVPVPAKKLDILHTDGWKPLTAAF